MPNPRLQYYVDGTPSILKKRTDYTKLNFYQRADVLYQLSKVFCARYFPKFGDRTVDQIVQSARSIKQNIVEGFIDGQTSSEIEIKLLGVARGSNQELLEDYMDYLKYNHLPEWRSSKSPRFDALYTFCKKHSLLADFQPYFERWNDEEIANCCVCMCHMVDKGLENYIKLLDKQFVEEGGIRERMAAARLERRASQKEQIAQLEAENAALNRENAALRAELARLNGDTSPTGMSGQSGISEIIPKQSIEL